MSDYEFVNVNEDGEEYGVHDSIEAAMAVNDEFPNDSVVVRRRTPDDRLDYQAAVRCSLRRDWYGAGRVAHHGGGMRVVPRWILVEQGLAAAEKWYAGWDDEATKVANEAVGL